MIALIFLRDKFLFRERLFQLLNIHVSNYRLSRQLFDFDNASCLT